MLSTQEVRNELGETAENMTDEQVVNLRGSLYTICENVIDNLYEIKE
jgi:hypothetical protein